MNNIQRTCFFIGHRDSPETVMPLLCKAVERHIVELGTSIFFVGQYGSFDRMAARAVIESKQYHSEVALRLLLPYHPFERPIELAEGFDGSFYPPGMETVPRRYAIVRANEYMVRHCNYLICYDCYIVGNTHKLVELAQRREKKGFIQVTNLAGSI